MTLREQLLEMADPAYRDFNASLIPGAGEILGVRIPRLRALAREIARGDAWREFVDAPAAGSFEERLVQGLVIGYAKCGTAEKLELVARFVPRIDNWALCDCFCWKLRAAERAPMWEFIQPYFCAEAEYDVRFAAVMATGNFVDGEHLAPLLARLGECRTMPWLAGDCPLDTPTFHRALRKIVESYRVSDEDKAAVRAMKRTTK